MLSGYKNMAVPNGGSVRLYERPAVIQSGEEVKIIIVAIKCTSLHRLRPFIVSHLKRGQSVCLNDRKGQRLLLHFILLPFLSSVSLCELEMLGPKSYSDVQKQFLFLRGVIFKSESIRGRQAVMLMVYRKRCQMAKHT